MFVSTRTTKDESLRSIQNDVSHSKKIGNNTFEVIYKDGNRAIRLHKTDVVTFGASLYTINTNGWQTPTAKNKINKYSPQIYVFQNDFKWYVHTNEGNLEYYDGMRFDYFGKHIPFQEKTND